MRLIQQSAEIWEQPVGEVGIYKQVEKAARLCYKSEDKTTEDSYKRFMNMLSEKGHNSPFEHGTVYLHSVWLGAVCDACKQTMPPLHLGKYCLNPYSKVTYHGNDVYITSNYRVLLENGWLDDLKYLCEPTEHHKKRVSVHITTSRAISLELVRHRVFSFSQESQRYCDYSKDKFGNELTFIIPTWVKTKCPNNNNLGPSFADMRWSKAMMQVESHYFKLLDEGWKPQQAREVLPNSTKTELVMTGFESDWEGFFKLRCSPVAHPMMRELANQIKDLIYGKLGNNKLCD